MNSAQSNLPLQGNIFQTWNPLQKPAPSKVLGEGHFERPIICHKSRAAQVALESLQGVKGLWLVGAYVKQGIPLLEAVRCCSWRFVAAVVVVVIEYLDILFFIYFGGPGLHKCA